MSILDHFDIRTILACQILLSAAFAIVFFAMSFAYRSVHGIMSIALGFLLEVPGAFLVALRGSVPDFVSIVLANALVLTAHLYVYFGLLQIATHKQKLNKGDLWTPCSAVVVSLLVVTWYSMMEHNIVPRILAVALTSGLIFAMAAIQLLRRSRGRPEMQLFAVFLLTHSAITLYRALGTARFGAPENFMQANRVQAFSMISNLVFISGLGIFLQLMIAGELNHAIEFRARQDLLTGVFNRLGIEERLCAELDRARRSRLPLSALLIDIDSFKAINDSAGHAAGDEALRLVSKGIMASLRSYDLLGRYGGDEFLLLLPETKADGAVEVADRIRKAVALSAEALSSALRPTLSIGVAENLREDSCTTLVARADAALYDAKLAGRDCVRRRDLLGTHPIHLEKSRLSGQGTHQGMSTQL